MKMRTIVIMSADRTSAGWKKRQDIGFTLIELMIVLAIIAVLLALAVPIYSSYTIRAKISEGLSVANAAVTAVSSACSENRAITNITNDKAGYRFARGMESDDYVWDIQASGSCSDPVITIETINTGRLPDPVLTITGKVETGNGQITWTCRSSNTPNNLLPGTCRS